MGWLSVQDTSCGAGAASLKARNTWKDTIGHMPSRRQLCGFSKPVSNSVAGAPGLCQRWFDEGGEGKCRPALANVTWLANDYLWWSFKLQGDCLPLTGERPIGCFDFDPDR